MTLRDEANALSLGAGACSGYALWWLTHKRLIPQNGNHVIDRVGNEITGIWRKPDTRYFFAFTKSNGFIHSFQV